MNPRKTWVPMGSKSLETEGKGSFWHWHWHTEGLFYGAVWCTPLSAVSLILRRQKEEGRPTAPLVPQNCPARFLFVVTWQFAFWAWSSESMDSIRMESSQPSVVESQHHFLLVPQVVANRF